jgi:hypothetical protein
MRKLSPVTILQVTTMSLSKKLTITDLQLAGKRALIRVDFNVPLQDGKITNPAVRRDRSSRACFSCVERKRFAADRCRTAYYQICP